MMAHSRIYTYIYIHLYVYILYYKLLAHFSLEKKKKIIKIVSNEKNCQALPINIIIKLINNKFKNAQGMS